MSGSKGGIGVELFPELKNDWLYNTIEGAWYCSAGKEINRDPIESEGKIEKSSWTPIWREASELVPIEPRAPNVKLAAPSIPTVAWTPAGTKWIPTSRDGIIAKLKF